MAISSIASTRASSTAGGSATGLPYRWVRTWRGEVWSSAPRSPASIRRTISGLAEPPPAAEGPAEQVHRLVLGQQGSLGQQRVQVVGEVPHPAPRIYRRPLGPA